MGRGADRISSDVRVLTPVAPLRHIYVMIAAHMTLPNFCQWWGHTRINVVYAEDNEGRTEDNEVVGQILIITLIMTTFNSVIC